MKTEATSKVKIGKLLGLTAIGLTLSVNVGLSADTTARDVKSPGHHMMTSPVTLSQTKSVPWDAQASAELTQELHRIHEIWNTGDIALLKKFMIGDNVLVTFELDPETHKPIELKTKADIDGFISKIVNQQADDGILTELEHPILRCRATATWGVCTEKCTVNIKEKATGRVLGTNKLISTQVAVKTSEGWRWIQWHMSQAAQAQSVLIRNNAAN